MAVRRNEVFQDAKVSWNENGDRVITSADGKETRVYEETMFGRGECKTIIDNVNNKSYEAEHHFLLGDTKGKEK